MAGSLLIRGRGITLRERGIFSTRHGTACCCSVPTANHCTSAGDAAAMCAHTRLVRMQGLILQWSVGVTISMIGTHDREVELLTGGFLAVWRTVGGYPAPSGVYDPSGVPFAKSDGSGNVTIHPRYTITCSGSPVPGLKWSVVATFFSDVVATPGVAFVSITYNRPLAPTINPCPDAAPYPVGALGPVPPIDPGILSVI